ncbi:hypothetical protein CSC32_3963 [Pseudomonas aeruginosa]|nr:hypothetical protein CSC32_3963 [Pseudomonas aeruginosa]
MCNRNVSQLHPSISAVDDDFPMPCLFSTVDILDRMLHLNLNIGSILLRVFI